MVLLAIDEDDFADAGIVDDARGKNGGGVGEAGGLVGEAVIGHRDVGTLGPRRGDVALSARGCGIVAGMNI